MIALPSLPQHLPSAPATLRAIERRIEEFEPENDAVLQIVRSHLRSLCDTHTSPVYIDKQDADALIADAVHCTLTLSLHLTAADQAELVRWIDFLPDAYEARERWHAGPRRAPASRTLPTSP